MRICSNWKDIVSYSGNTVNLSRKNTKQISFTYNVLKIKERKILQVVGTKTKQTKKRSYFQRSKRMLKDDENQMTVE